MWNARKITSWFRWITRAFRRASEKCSFQQSFLVTDELSIHQQLLPGCLYVGNGELGRVLIKNGGNVSGFCVFLLVLLDHRQKKTSHPFHFAHAPLELEPGPCFFHEPSSHAWTKGIVLWLQIWNSAFSGAQYRIYTGHISLSEEEIQSRRELPEWSSDSSVQRVPVLPKVPRLALKSSTTRTGPSV